MPSITYPGGDGQPPLPAVPVNLGDTGITVRMGPDGYQAVGRLAFDAVSVVLYSGWQDSPAVALAALGDKLALYYNEAASSHPAMSGARFGHGQMFIFGKDQRVEILRKASAGRWPGHERSQYVWIANIAGRQARVPIDCIRVDPGAQHPVM